METHVTGVLYAKAYDHKYHILANDHYTRDDPVNQFMICTGGSYRARASTLSWRKSCKFNGYNSADLDSSKRMRIIFYVRLHARSSKFPRALTEGTVPSDRYLVFSQRAHLGSLLS